MIPDLEAAAWLLVAVVVVVLFAAGVAVGVRASRRELVEAPRRELRPAGEGAWRGQAAVPAEPEPTSRRAGLVLGRTRVMPAAVERDAAAILVETLAPARLNLADLRDVEPAPDDKPDVEPNDHDQPPPATAEPLCAEAVVRRYQPETAAEPWPSWRGGPSIPEPIQPSPIARRVP